MSVTGNANILTEAPSLPRLPLLCEKLILPGTMHDHADLFLGTNPMPSRLNSLLSAT